MSKHTTVGIIGGMGPDATVELMNQIIAHTKAEDDKDHIHMLVDNNPKIPSRRNAILFDGESPAPALIAIAQRLESMGANLLIMPCNTAHYYYDVLNQATNIDLWNLLKISAQSIKKQKPNIQRIGILATQMSRQLQLFEPYFKQQGITLIYPNDRDQEIITNMILAVKKASVNAPLLKAYNGVLQRFLEDSDSDSYNCESLLLGCSELSVLHSPLRPNAIQLEAHQSANIYDPIQILARCVVDYICTG